MQKIKLSCSAAKRLASDFHCELSNQCERCETGRGACLAELIFGAAEMFVALEQPAERKIIH